MQDLEKHPRIEEARRHVRDVRGFYVHALTYVLVIGGLALVNHLGNPGRLWFVWPAMGWGIGLVVHGISVFAFGWLGAEWEERKIREYLDRRA
jgi:uncharacterized membrane protein